MPDSTQSKKIDKISLKIGSGIILSVIFLLLGYLINNALSRNLPTSFDNAVSKNIIIIFLGLLSGYNIANSLKKEGGVYYFYTGIFLPIFVVVLYGLLTNEEYISSVFVALGLAFPIIFIHSGLVESHKKFKVFIDFFGKYIPNITVVTIAVGDFAIPLIEFHMELDIGTYNYIVGFVAAIVFIWFLSWLDREL